MSESLFWQRFQRTLERKVDEFQGIAGVAVVDLVTGYRLEVKGSLQFPAASTIKVHLLAALVQQHVDGVVNLDDRVEVTERVAGSPILGCLDDFLELSWRDLASLMIIVSDNTATNMIIDRIRFDRMVEFFQSWGLSSTVLARKMKDQDAVRSGLENLSTPLDSVQLLERLWSGTGFAPGVADECLRILRKPKKSTFRAAFPPNTTMANKPGELPRVQCEMAIVYLPTRPFGLSVMSSFGPADSTEHVRWFYDLARSVYDSMAVLDACSSYGRG